MKLDASRISFNNSDLALAFPASVLDDAVRMVSTLPQPSWSSETFSVRLGGETLLVPYRIYHDAALIDPAQLKPLQVELLDCLLTRHHSGFVREKHLKNIVCCDHEWIPPFVVQLVGEYVIEIVDAIRNNLPNLNPQLYRRFLQHNPTFLALTKERVYSYWDCYHRHQRRAEYAGFQIIELFDNLAGEANSRKTESGNAAHRC